MLVLAVEARVFAESSSSDPHTSSSGVQALLPMPAGVCAGSGPGTPPTSMLLAVLLALSGRMPARARLPGWCPRVGVAPPVPSATALELGCRLRLAVAALPPTLPPCGPP